MEIANELASQGPQVVDMFLDRFGRQIRRCQVLQERTEQPHEFLPWRQVLRKPFMPESELLYKVDPDYPSAALQHRIQGTVRFNVVIGKDGHVERLTLVSGHPLLVQAAREAARRWIYRPATVDGKPVRVITDIDVQFQLDPYGKPLKRSNGSSNSAA